MAEEEQMNRKGDFEFSFGPFKFKGKGFGTLVGFLVVGIGALCLFAVNHTEQTKEMTGTLRNLDSGQRLLACIISEDTGPQRKAQLRDPNSDCRRFARGDF